MIYVGIFSVGTRKECVLCHCWVECSINVKILLVDGVIEFFCILANILSNCPTSCSFQLWLWICLFLFWDLSIFASHIFTALLYFACTFNVLCLLSALTLLSLHNFSGFVIFFSLKSTLSDINVAVHAFFD